MFADQLESVNAARCRSKELTGENGETVGGVTHVRCSRSLLLVAEAGWVSERLLSAMQGRTACGVHSHLRRWARLLDSLSAGWVLEALEVQCLRVRSAQESQDNSLR